MYKCEYHLVLVSKYRRKIFNKGSFSYFVAIMKQVAEKLPDVIIIEMNHNADHIHLLMSVPPKKKSQ